VNIIDMASMGFRTKSVTSALLAGILCGCAAPSDVTMSQAADATYSGVIDEPVTLVDGRYEGRAYADAAASRPVVQLLRGPALVADIDGDGFDEAVVVLASSFGGSGSYTWLAVVEAFDGLAQSVAPVSLGDRVRIEALTLDNRIIRTRTLEHGPSDAMCCPSARRIREWTFSDGILSESGDGMVIERLVGHVRVGHEVRSFRACSSEQDAWLVDRTGGDLADIVKQLAPGQYAPLFVEVDGAIGPPPDTGFGADYDSSLTVFELRRAEREGFGCSEDRAGFAFRARGNEPSWQLVISGSTLSFSTMAGGAVDAAYQFAVLADGTIRASGNSDEASIEADITELRCVDTMSDSIFDYTARVRVDSTEYRGCATRGVLPVE